MTRSANPLRPSRLAGPGLCESIGWIIAYLLAQGIVCIGLVALLILAAFEGVPHSVQHIQGVLEQMDSADLAWVSVYATGGATLGALFLIVPAACLRLGPAPREALGTKLPDARQLVLLAGAVLPLGILADEVYRAASLAWALARSDLERWWPVLEHLGRSDTIDLVQSQSSSTAYPLLLVIVGVGPAIGEELVFRGVIGRGLVNRFGVGWGVLVTSLLFAMAHGAPAHALATLPLAVFLHLTYLATRTIWAPILVHFLNNALSVTMLKYGLGQDVDVSVFMLLSAAVYVTAIGAMLWHTRGAGWGEESESATPSGLPTLSGRGLRAVSPRWLTLAATSGVLGFTWTFVAAAMAGS